MKKDFVTITPDTGGGSATPQVTAEPNFSAMPRKTSLTFAANGQPLNKVIEITQIGSFFQLFTFPNFTVSTTSSNQQYLLKMFLNSLDYDEVEFQGQTFNVPYYGVQTSKAVGVTLYDAFLDFNLLFSTEAINSLGITDFVADIESNAGGVKTLNMDYTQDETNLGVSEYRLSTKSIIGLNTLHQVTFYAIINGEKMQICRVENAV